MRALRVALALVLALVATALWPEWGPWRPDFVLLVVLAVAFAGGADAGWMTGVGAGLAFSGLSLEPFGLDAALLGAAGLAGTRAARWFRGDQAAVQALTTLGMALALGILRLLRLELAGSDPASLSLLPGTVAGALATAALAPVAMPLARALRPAPRRRDRSAVVL